MSTTETARRESNQARFTQRVAFHEEPSIAEQLERLAHRSGRSVAAEWRASARYWLAAHDAHDRDD